MIEGLRFTRKGMAQLLPPIKLQTFTSNKSQSVFSFLIEDLILLIRMPLNQIFESVIGPCHMGIVSSLCHHHHPEVMGL